MGTLLKTEFPYVHAVAESYASTVCSYCMKMAFDRNRLQQCTRCRFVHYCNATCQKRDWADHKVECRLISKSSAIAYPEMVRIFARLVSKKGKSVKPAFNGRTLESLVSHREEIRSDPSQMSAFESFAAAVISFMGHQNVPPRDEMLEIYGKLIINVSVVQLSVGPPVGIGLYIGLSELDHSCDPDAIAVFSGATKILRGLKEGVTKYDKKLRVNYCGFLACGPVRRKFLNERYFFNCDCAICSDATWDSVARSLRCQHCKLGYCPLFLDGDTVVSKPECVHCGVASSLDIDDAVALMKEIDVGLKKMELAADFGAFPIVTGKKTYAKSESMLSHFNISLCRLTIALAYAVGCSPLARDRASKEYCARLHVKALVCYRHYLDDHHPLVCIQYHNVGATHLFCSNIETARIFLQKGLRLAIETFGSEDVFTLQTKKMLKATNERGNLGLVRALLTSQATCYFK